MAINNHNTDAEVAIRATGARTTLPRVTILEILQQSDCALTQTDIESRLLHPKVADRVTIYRVLEWLTEKKLAHKVQGLDRLWRFNAIAHKNTLPHAHFQCNDCGKVLCLDNTDDKPYIALPAGFKLEAVELLVKGSCSDC